MEKARTRLRDTASEKDFPVSSSQSYKTTTFSGERLSKADKLFAAIGTVEEVIAYLGVIKAEHCVAPPFRQIGSQKLFLSARLTQIQENLNRIVRSLGTSRKVNAQYENSRFAKIFDKAMEELKEEISTFDADSVERVSELPGQNLLESQLHYARTLVRRAERQVICVNNLELGIVAEKEVVSYLNELDKTLHLMALNYLKYETPPRNE